MAIWKKSLSVPELNAMCQGTIHDALDIRFVEIGEDSMSAVMKVHDATRQPFGVLHGGASVVLAESLGSMAAFLMCEENEIPAGIEVNANHLRPVREGSVRGEAMPVHLGRSLQVWSIDIIDEAEKLVCVARLTVSIVTLKAPTT